MEETTEICTGTIVTTKIQATYAIATSSSGTNLVTSQNNQPISLVGVLVIVVLTCRLCCDKNGVLTEETTTAQNLQVIQVNVIRTSKEPALHEGNCV